MGQDIVLPADLSDPTPHNHSHAIVENGRLHMSGQVAVDADGNRVGDDVETQARQAFENVSRLLDAVDCEFDDVVKVTSYIVDVQSNFESFVPVYREVFDAEPYPCHTALGVESLPSPDLLVELEVDVPLK